MKEGRQRPRPPEASTVVPYDPDWTYAFERIERRLRPLFPEPDVAIEHVGSTAVRRLVGRRGLIRR